LAVYRALTARLARFLPNAPPLNGQDIELLAEARTIGALPDRYWHESGRWVIDEKADHIWDRLKERLITEAEAEAGLSDVQKRQTARNRKRYEILRERRAIKFAREWEKLA
jgi:hypothetical protein